MSKIMIKKLISAALMLALIFSINPAVFAAEGDTRFTDVSMDAWYAEAVAYVQENDLIDSISDDEFAPDRPASRITLAVALYRAENSPAVSTIASFSDVKNGTEYSDAVAWAVENGIVSGYGNGIFGINDSITREQIAAMLWRYAEQPEANDNVEVFADQNIISEWAQTAVSWARSNSVVSGMPNNLFDPQDTVTRAEAATLLMNYLTQQQQSTEQPEPSSKMLVVYFSMPETANPNNMTQEEDNSVVVINGEVLGNTQYIAYLIQENTDADIFRIEPKTPYPTKHDTLVDLAKEEQNKSARPELSVSVSNLEQYEVIFLGYPNWWGDMPMILYSFLESIDLSGKTIIPFNTHGGSGLSDTINTIAKLQPNAMVEKKGSQYQGTASLPRKTVLLHGCVNWVLLSSRMQAANKKRGEFIMKYVTLNNNIKMPILGFGVFQIADPVQCEQAVLHALQAGYRLIDTAMSYQNEEAVGKAIQKSGVLRSELFITTKLWLADAGYDKTMKAFETSLNKLGLEYLDLYLIHQPVGDYYGSWRAMEELYKTGIVRAIGVANFMPDRLVDLVLNNEIPPAINQVEVNPFCQRTLDQHVMEKKEVQIQSWGPFAEGRNSLFENETLKSIGNKYGKSIAQVVLRWLIQRGIVCIPKSVHKERIEENFNVFNFVLDGEDMQTIASLDTGKSCFFSHQDPAAIEMLCNLAR